jgi:hypothetical protein
MKLKRYNRQNSLSKKEGISSIRIAESGMISISATLYSKLNPGHKSDIYLEFLQDEESPEDWYIVLSDEKIGFRVRNKSEQKSFMFNSASLCRKLITQVQPPSSTDTRFTLRVKEDPIEIEGIKKAWLIITKPLNK